ncbi:MAG: beta-N-acetylhexosaminidase [Clostridia bacterium]|nr:beta-N-acetylhexosaminidase [Clostridia bacterium]
MSFERIGVSICCAGNCAMSVEGLKRFIDCIAKMEYGILEICIDDMYKIDSEPYFGYLRGGYTREEIQEIDAYAKSKNVELIPVIQTLAHLTNLVKIPHYADIVDIDDILLIDEPKTYELIDKMFESIANSFSTRNINIGFDEAHHVGLGRYLDQHGYTNRYELLLRHLNRVVEIAEKYGFKIHMWSDMFFRIANGGEYYVDEPSLPEEIADLVPKQVGLCYWDYYHNDESFYDKMLTAHQKIDNELWFVGGAWTWNGFAPQNRYSMNNSLPAIRQAKAHGVKNVLISLWDDDGHDCSYFSVLPSLYAIRQYMDGIEDETQIKQGFKELFDYDFDDFMLLDLPCKNKKNEHYQHADNSCKSLLYNDCFLGKKDYELQAVYPIDYPSYRKALSEAGDRMGEFGYLFENLSALCDLLSVKYDLGLRTRKAYSEKDRAALGTLVKDYEQAAEKTDTFRNTLRRVWMQENKPYGWSVQELRLGGVKAHLLDCKERIEEYLSGKTKSIPELEETLLPYASWESQYNCYCGFVTVGKL